ncbi:MAG: SMP-30/gluconolactonase/LRE family protein [Pirellulaceae bacterium]|nr:SMP-30/gluconolactonase/LRE family protein [Pirellulaceae bacterium]
MPPVLRSGDKEFQLIGRWQYRPGADESFTSLPLPAKFGGSADIVLSPPEPLWTPRALTRRGEFTSGIEGPACDAEGNLYVVNFARQGTIGRVRRTGAGEVFVALPGKSIGNGIRLDRDGSFFVADYTEHNIWRVDTATRGITLHAHQAAMNQPNDLAIADDGTLYASDPNWTDGTGQLWRIDRDGTTTLLAKEMGTTNGIEVSPDGKTLYVNESKQRNLWAFTITAQRTLTDKRLLKQFPDHGFDGMRCDVDGNLYVTRYGKGVVCKLSPAGEVLREIPTLGAKPSNICFGGPDGCTAYVTEVESTRIVTFRVDRPGRSWNP